MNRYQPLFEEETLMTKTFYGYAPAHHKRISAGDVVDVSIHAVSENPIRNIPNGCFQYEVILPATSLVRSKVVTHASGDVFYDIYEPRVFPVKAISAPTPSHVLDTKPSFKDLLAREMGK